MNNVEQIAREARLRLNNEVVTLDNDQYEIASNIITEAITAAIAPLLEKKGQWRLTNSSRKLIHDALIAAGNTDEQSEQHFANAIAPLQSENKELRDWKESMLEVESTWNEQRVGHALGLALGSAIKPQIEPKIRELQAELEQAQKQLDENWVTHQRVVQAEARLEGRSGSEQDNDRVSEIGGE